MEVQVDDGDWQAAELAEPVSGRPGANGCCAGTPPPGRHRIRVRATDGEGETQPEERSGVRPDGATGWHTVSVAVAG